MAKKKMVESKRPTLVEHTRAMLANRPRTLTVSKIAETIDVSASWIESFSSGRIKDPSANSIQKLYEFLSGEKLNY